MKILTLEEIRNIVRETNYLNLETNSRTFELKFDETWVNWINKLLQQGQVIRNLNYNREHGLKTHTPVMQALLSDESIKRDRYILAMVEISNFILENPDCIEHPEKFMDAELKEKLNKKLHIDDFRK